MCASYEARFGLRQLVELFSAAGAPLALRGGLPNLEPIGEVRPTDAAMAVRLVDGAADLVPMRFGFPPPPGRKGGPVINYRSEGREISNGGRQGRALVPASGFFEFTGEKYPKTRWKLAAADGAPLLLAAVWRAGEAGEAFSLLTAEPGPDVAPYHTRGVLPLPPGAWADWLFGRRPTAELLSPPPAGTLTAVAAPRGG
jgi:putative SOS response-associated peptidase YedK